MCVCVCVCVCVQLFCDACRGHASCPGSPEVKEDVALRGTRFIAHVQQLCVSVRNAPELSHRMRASVSVCAGEAMWNG